MNVALQRSNIKPTASLAVGMKQDFLEKMDEIGLKKYDFELEDGTSVTAFEAGIEQLGPAAQTSNLVMPTTIGYNVPTPTEQTPQVYFYIVCCSVNTSCCLV